MPGGFRVNGTKVWTSGAHRNHYCITLVRTSGQHGDRHKGLSQLLVDLKTPGVTIRPIINLAGRHDWNEVTFSDAFIPEDCLIGNEGDGWLQVTSELAFERSGPERFMQNFYVLRELVRVLGRQPAKRASAILGRLIARLWTLRQMSTAVAGMMQGGKSPAIEASLVKDLGTIYQQDLPEIAAHLAESDATTEEDLADFLDIAQYATDDGAELHHPGRHHSGPARHRRPRPRTALRRTTMDRETRDMLLETAGRFFTERSGKDVVNGVEKGVWPADLWKEIEEMGLPLIAVPEGAGGRRRHPGRPAGAPAGGRRACRAGAARRDGARQPADRCVGRQAGRAARRRWRWADSLSLQGNRLTGRVARVPFASVADRFVAVVTAGGKPTLVVVARDEASVDEDAEPCRRALWHGDLRRYARRVRQRRRPSAPIGPSSWRR